MPLYRRSTGYVPGLIALCLLGGAPAQAQDAMARCAALADDRARLACYDSVAPPLRTAPASAVPAAPRPAPRKQGWFSGLFGNSAPKTADQFGRENLPTASKPAAIARLNARVTGYSFAPITHFFTIALDNGQIWQQDDGDTSDARLTQKADSYSVSITPGMFGSYNMTIRGLGGSFKVHRIR